LEFTSYNCSRKSEQRLEVLMPLQATSGAASYDAFGGGVPVVTNYIEDVFSTYLLTGNASTQTITNNIDLSTYGGLVWSKNRSTGGGTDNCLNDSARNSFQNRLVSNSTTAQEVDFSSVEGVTSVSSTGFVFRSFYTGTYVTWTFRKQPKFFDVVTYTGTGSNTTIAHNLGSVPACIIVKRTDATGAWQVYHRSLANTEYLVLNTTAAKATGATRWNSTTPTSTVFSVGTDATVNASGGTYVAYIFAHDAGGFGLTGTDNVISCGSFTYSGSEVPVNLGYEPQFILAKTVNRTIGWEMYDVMRGMPAGTGSNVALLSPNSSGAESVAGYPYHPTATGFIVDAGYYTNPTTVIYIAIRRGPMKVPTSGTSVFSPVTYTGNATARSISGLGFPPDLVFPKIRDNGGGFNGTMTDRLRGATNYLIPNDTSAEATNANYVTVLGQDGFSLGSGADVNRNTSTFISWNFRRAPSFFDEVCVTPSYPTPVTHNLGAVPKLRFEKTRSITAEWKAIYFDGTTDEYELALNSTRAAQIQSGRPALPTSTSFVAYYDGTPLVVYLFAPLSGVQYISKFTGNGSSQTINCGFTGGARFICIKAFSTTGDWKVIDTARGIVSGNDPTLAFNTTSAEVTGTDCIDPDSSGFIVNQESTNNLNVNGVEYLVWAIA
jgi:hypothetical protein